MCVSCITYAFCPICVQCNINACSLYIVGSWRKAECLETNVMLENHCAAKTAEQQRHSKAK